MLFINQVCKKTKLWIHPKNKKPSTAIKTTAKDNNV